MSKKARKLRKENNDLTRKLTSENDKVLTDMVVYIRSADISDYQQERVRRDVIQMILDGESRGETIENIIGEDYHSFCDNVLGEVPKLSTKEKLFSFVGNGSLFLMVWSVNWLVFQMIEILISNVRFSHIPVTMGDLVCAVLIICFAAGIFKYTAQNAFEDTLLQNRKIMLLLFGALCLCVTVNVVLEKVLFSVHVAAVIVEIAGLFLIYKIIDIKE